MGIYKIPNIDYNSSSIKDLRKMDQEIVLRELCNLVAKCFRMQHRKVFYTFHSDGNISINIVINTWLYKIDFFNKSYLRFEKQLIDLPLNRLELMVRQLAVNDYLDWKKGINV